MNIYWKKIEVWCKYPFQDTIDYRYIAFSGSKKKFEDSIFMECDTQISMDERLKLVQEIIPTATKLIKL